MKKIVLGIVAHVDSGKTTLSESLLFKSGNIKKMGRVDNKDAVLDTYEIEKKRGITVFSKQAMLKLENTEISLLDTPGHVDFSGEMERTLQVLDYAILVVNGSNGVQSHTKTLWELLCKHNIPTFIFANKMDLVNADKDKVLKDLKDNLSDRIIDFSCEKYCLDEKISLNNEKLLDIFLEKGELNTKEIASVVKNRDIFPCFFGCALKLDGIDEIINALDQLTIQDVNGGEFKGRVFKISRDNQNTRLTYIKVTNGDLKVKDVINDEKINQIRVYSGDKFKVVDSISEGGICALVGLNETYVGQGLNQEDSKIPVLQPILTYNVLLKDYDSIKAYEKLKVLQQEDPLLNIIWNEKSKTISIQLMGDIQIEILQNEIKQRFDIDVEFGQGNILYKETILETVEGVGHFEPLRHYSEVRLLLEPMPNGTGLVFTSKCSEDKLSSNWQNLIIYNLSVKNHRGILTGSYLTDMKISIVDGRAHTKHTEGGDFRQATLRAVQQALRKSKSQLLEPYYEFKISLPNDNLGRLMNDIQKMGGTFNAPKILDQQAELTGQAPVVNIRQYGKELASYTKGLGLISLSFKGYFACHNQKEIIDEISYDYTQDLDSNPDSVFCENGSGFIVDWKNVEDFAHTEPYLKKKEEEIKPVIHRAQVTQYKSNLEQDKELLKIFERTYGKVKTDTFLSFNSPSKETQGTIKSTIAIRNEYLLVDGYNVIFGWDELNELAKVDVGAARDKLADILCNYQGFKKCEVVLVFDAYKVKGGVGGIEQYHNITIVYTKEAETADMYIEKTTKKIARDRYVRVVTSDALEQIIILGHGAYRVSTNMFKEEVEQIEKAIKEICL